MRANNPVDAGLLEIGVIWPSTRKPDLVLSVGTGYVETPESPAVKFLQGILTDGMIPRLFRSFYVFTICGQQEQLGDVHEPP